MKGILMIFGFIFCVLNIQAQKTEDVQKAMKEAQEKLKQLKSNPQYQEAMKKAQQAMQQLKSDTAVQKQMSDANSQLNSLKETHPELAGVQIPDLDQIKVPDVNQLIQKLDTGLNTRMAMMQHFADATPKPNPSHQAEQLPVLNTVDLKALAQSILNTNSIEGNILMRAKLDTLAKRKDLNVAGTGLFYLSLGLSPDAAAYLIAKGVLLHPTDPYAANALGVYYRDKNALERSLQCYFYADHLLPDSLKSPYVYANIGWASFYYGDFSASEKYFGKALSLSSNFQPALEGNASLAYAKGDIKALFQCLAKELEASLANSTRSLGAGGGNGGPSAGFTAICGGATGTDEESNPSDNHTFDNLGKENNTPEQDPPPGADVTFPSLFFPVFNIKDLNDIPAAVRQFNPAFSNGWTVITAIRKKKTDINARFYGVSYFDDHGDLMHDRDYTKFSALHGMISVLFQRRISQLITDFNKETLTPFGENVLTSFRNAQPVIMACRDTKCLCDEYRHLCRDGNSLLASGSESWSKLYDNIIKECRWYLRNDAAIVSRVHDPKCNEVLNLDREDKVRTAILGAYGCWLGIIQPLLPYSGFAIASEKCPSYGVEARVISAPNPFSKKPKHIKEFPEPNCKDMDFPIGVLGSITENCHYTKFTIGPKIGPIQLGFTYTTNKDWTTGKVKDKIYSENNDFDHGYGVTVGIAYKFDDVVEVDASAGGTVNYNAKGQATGYSVSGEAGGAMDFGIAKLGGKANSTWQMNADGQITGHSNSLTGSASIGGNAPTEENNPNQKSPGFGVGGEYTSTSNYDANGNYIGGNNSATLSLQQSATTNGGQANKEVAGQNNVFGIQSNQVIQVVAGAKQMTPFTAQ